MTDKKEEEKEVSGWDQLELSAQITIIIIIIIIGTPITVGFFLYIAHKYKVYSTDIPNKRKQIKNIDKELSCSNSKIKLKTVSKIPEVTKPCSCYFYDLRTDFKLLGCTDNNNEIHYPNDSNKINSHPLPLPHSNPHTLPNPHPHSNSHTHSISHTHPNSHTLANPHSKSHPHPTKLLDRPNPLPNHTHT